MKTRRSHDVAYTFDPSISLHNRYQRDLQRALKASLENLETIDFQGQKDGASSSKPDVAAVDLDNSSDKNDANLDCTIISSSRKPAACILDTKENTSNEMSSSAIIDSAASCTKPSSSKLKLDRKRSFVAPPTSPLLLTRRSSTLPLSFSIRRRNTEPQTLTRGRKRALKGRGTPEHDNDSAKRTSPRSLVHRDSHSTGLDPYYRNLYQRELKQAMKYSIFTHEKESEKQQIEEDSLGVDVEDAEGLDSDEEIDNCSPSASANSSTALSISNLGDVETSSVSSSFYLSESVDTLPTSVPPCILGNIETSCAAASSSFALGGIETSSFASSSCIVGSVETPSTASTSILSKPRHNTRGRKRSSENAYTRPIDNTHIASKRRATPSVLTQEEFLELWRKAELQLGFTLEYLENKTSLRFSNNHRDHNQKNLSSNQTRAMYGRTLFSGMEKITSLAKLKRNEIFLDIGHGLGNAVFQAAFTVGCSSRGVEVVPERCRIANKYDKALHEIAVANVDHFGSVELREGSLTDEAHRKFMSDADVVLVNNAGHVFGVRSGNIEGKPTLDECVSGLFAMMKPGTRMITFEPLLCLGRSLSDENEMRQKNNLAPSSNASFYTCSKHNLGEKVVHWTDKETFVYLYTRVRESVFLCCNPKCSWNNFATAAVDENSGLLQDECVYCSTPRPRNTRKYR